MRYINLSKETIITGDILEFLSERVSDDQLSERADQVAFIVRDDDEIVATLSVFETHSDRLGHNFYAYRIFVKESHRKKHIAGRLLNMANAYYEHEFLRGATKNIGVLILSENQAFNTYRNEAIWPATGFTFIGYGPKEEHIRVKYFREARISPRRPQQTQSRSTTQ